MGVVRKTAPVILNSLMCIKASQKASAFCLCLDCSKLFYSFQPVIYENIFEEIVELKYCILPGAHHYV